MEEVKKDKTSCNIIIIIILMIMVLGLGGYIFYDKVMSKDSDVTTPKTEEKEEIKETELIQETEKINEPKNFVFDASKVINQKDAQYELASYADGGLSAELENQRTVKITVAWEKYGPLINAKGVGSLAVTNEQFDLNKKVVDIYAAGMGQTYGGETFLYLMEDGTVEYTPMKLAATKNVYKSYGTLSGVTDVVRFSMANVSYNGIGASATILAFKSDGTFYDLGPILRATGNY